MARPLRIEYEGAFCHLTARGNERREIYFTKTDYGKFKEYLEGAQEKFMIIETPNANIGKVMHYINGSYTNYINRKRNRSGHLFQGRYKAILIDQDSYLLELSRYIHLNPVKANIVEKPENYSYSSYRSYILNKRNDGVYRIGQIFNDLSFSAVAKVNQRISKAVKENRAIRKKVEKIISKLS